jgi:hypothetical protein
MFQIKNIVEDEIIFSSSTQNDFICKVKSIAIENEDSDMNIKSTFDAISYLREYCSNLIFLSEENV